MQGFLITYNSSQKEDITKINHHLFGRVSRTGSKEYYYSGELEDTQYFKITNGCYFTTQPVDDCDGLIDIIPAEIFPGEEVETMTAGDHWNRRLGSREVTNWKK